MNSKPEHNKPAPDRNLVAAKLSVIPGLGQLYKGHYVEAAFVLAVGGAMAAWIGTLLCYAYAAQAYASAFGFSASFREPFVNPVTIFGGLVPALIFWAWAALEAYVQQDLRH